MVCVLIDGVTTPIRSFRMEMDDGCPKMILPVRVDLLLLLLLLLLKTTLIFSVLSKSNNQET